MSAIQDALRKAQKERERAAQPEGRASAEPLPSIPGQKRPVRRRVLAVALLLGAASAGALYALGVVGPARTAVQDRSAGPATQMAPAGGLTNPPPARAPVPGGAEAPRSAAVPARPAPPPQRPPSLEEARRMQAAGDTTGAEAALRALMGREPQRVEVITALAGLYLQDRRDPARALPLYERAAGLDPQRPAILVNLGVALLRAGLGTRAAEQFQKALSMDPGLAEAHYNLACARALLGDREGAEQALARAAALDPRSSQWAKDDPDLALLRAPKEANRP